MINVNQITSQLARMPDQALQQYAQMHKNDPYTVTLALAESNRRKEMRTNAQGQQGMAPQPKVVDQDIAEMASPMPEDVGIGALPAPNMQGMAEGGIVAFAEGELVQDRSPDAINERYRLSQLQKLKDLFGITGASRGYQSGFTPEEKEAGIASAAVPPPISDTPYRNEGRGFMPPAPVAPPAPAPRENANAGPGSVRAPSVAMPTAADYADQFKTLRGKLDDKDPQAEMVAERSRLAEKQGLERLAEFNADIAKQGDVYAKKDARLVKREEDITKQESSNTGLAFLNAGLAIMSTPGGLATAIGKGARVGTEQFAAGLDKINRAKDLLGDAQDRADDLKLAREDMTTQQRRAIKSDINKDMLAAKDLAIAGARAAGASTDKIALSALEQAGAFARTKMTTDATRDAAATAARASVGRLSLAEERLALDTLRAQAKTLGDQLKTTVKKEDRQKIQRQIDDINTQLSGGTIAKPSAAATPGGNRPALGSFQR